MMRLPSESAVPASSVRARLLDLAGWVAALAIMVLRMPDLWRHPRFWAEEGAVYFAAACGRSAAQSLFSPHLGYYALYDNLGAWLASRVPLVDAPCVTLLASALGLLLVLSLVSSSRSELLQGRWRKALLVLFLLCGSYAETWLNLIHVQFLFAVGSWLILIEPPPAAASRLRFGLHAGLLLLFGLTGVVSLLLVPGFAWQAWRERDVRRWGQLGILVGCGLLQLLALWWCLHSGDTGPRFGFPGAGVLLHGLLINVSMLIGASNPGRLGIVPGLLALGLLAWLPPRWRLLCVGLFGINSLGSLLLSVQMLGGARYALLSAVILLCGLLGLSRGQGWPARAAAALALACVLVVCLRWHAHAEQMDAPDWPRWPQEVALWRADPAHALQIAPQWPGNSWSLPLEPACDRPARAAARP